jgi:cytidylate kinase
VLEGIRRRDQFDASRTVAPMSRAEDAVEVNTDGMSPPEVIARIVELAQERGARRRATSSPRRQSKHR